MTQWTLVRFAYLPKGTISELIIPGLQTPYTIQRPWLDNQANISCIPDGVYPLEWDLTGRITNVPRLRGTEPRTQINIHIANDPHELQGCIAPCERWVVLGQEPSGRYSTSAMDKILAIIPDDLKTQDQMDLGITLTVTSRNAIWETRR